MVPTANLINLYEMKTGLTTDESGSGYDATHPFKDRDPRMAMTVCYPGANYITPEGKTAIYNTLDQTLPGGKKNEDYPESANNSSKTGLTWNKYTAPANQYADVWSTNASPYRLPLC